MPPKIQDFTVDEFLGGSFYLKQPQKGFRAGTDSILLAASIQLKCTDSFLELGCGSGAVLMALAHRYPNHTFQGIEFDKQSYEYAIANTEKLQNPAKIHLLDVNNITKLPAYSHLQQNADSIAMNPPFFQNSSQQQKSMSRMLARAFFNQDDELRTWFKTANFLLRDQGLLTIIYPTLSLDTVITVARKSGFRGFNIYPIWPKEKTGSKRVLIKMQKNSKKPATLRSGLILHEEDGRLTSDAERVLRHGYALNIDH